MKRLFPVLLLAGCAAAPDLATLQQMATTNSIDELCYVRVSARATAQVQSVASAELQRRGKGCGDSWQYVQARLQSDAQRAATNAAQLQATTAALQTFIQAPRPPLSCTSIAMGGGFVNTTCQ